MFIASMTTTIKATSKYDLPTVDKSEYSSVVSTHDSSASRLYKAENICEKWKKLKDKK